MKPLFIKKSTLNIFVAFLELLNVKHTKTFSGKYYQEHPHKYSLYGISKMLTDYKIENIAIRSKNKTKTLRELEVPFVAYVASDFVIVFRITQENVDYLWRNKPISVPPEKFLDIWTGIALIAEPDNYSSEPNYKENKKKEIYGNIRKNTLFLFSILLVSLLLIQSNQSYSIGHTVALFINSAGIYISTLLLLKQMHIQSDYADKICSLLLHQGDCNNILESDAAKLWGVISWSEVGLGYFISNSIIIVCFPQLYPYLALFNIFTLPYTLWSVWYQKKIARQWCPLCLIVQVVLWFLFLNNTICGYIQLPVVSTSYTLWISCIYTIPFLVINSIVPVLANSKKIEQITYEINSIKATDEVFDGLLKKQPYYKADKSDSAMLWGNTEAENRITVVTNPHCNPCATMHNRLVNLLNSTGNGYCIQYIFTSFNKELESSTKLLIALYQNTDSASFLNALEDWYKQGKYQKENFFQKHPFDIESTKVTNELNNHNKWSEETKINSTPTLLFNGYKLPKNYKVEDLSYFTTIKHNST